MSRTKFTESLKYSEAVPRLMKFLKISTPAGFAKYLGISTAARWNAENKDIVRQSWLNTISMKENLPLGEVINIAGGKEKTEDERKAIAASGGYGILRSIEANTSRPLTLEGEGGQPEGKRQTEAEVPREILEEVLEEIPIQYGLPSMAKPRRYKVKMDLVKEWVDQSFPPASRSNLISWIVDEDTMAPTIKRNSFVLIDRGDLNVKAAGIFGFQNDTHIRISRVYPRLDGNIDIVNDNRAYPSFNCPEKQLYENPAFRVIGRVIFYGNHV